MDKNAVIISLAIVAFATTPCAVQAKVELTHISTVYLPAEADRRPAFDKGAVEKLAYDVDRKIIYAVGQAVFHVLRVQPSNTLEVLLTRYETDVDFTDVQVCGDHVFICLRNFSDQSKGSLRIYTNYQTASDPFQLVDEIAEGIQPDNLYVRENCRTIVIAAEAKPYISGSILVDPESEVTVVNFPANSAYTKDQATVKNLRFNAFNDRVAELQPTGVRFVDTTRNNKLSNDLEPEYVAIDEASNKAYVVLQENNAIAEVNLETDNITNIYGLGYKQWGKLDPSDRDGGVHIQEWPIRAWYSPDSTVFYQWQGRKLLFTASEGSTKEYLNFDEKIRGADIDQSSLGDSIPENVKTALNDETKLGRLEFSKFDGKDQNGKYNALYTFGARSFSIWDVSNPSDRQALPLVFDSGSQFEERSASQCPHLFNRDDDVVDGRSDSKGPRPESIAVGEIDGRLYIFIGNKPGYIFVYSLGSDVSQARFETIFCDGTPNESGTMEELLADRKIYAVYPEGLGFFPASQSPTGRPVLMVAAEGSGSVTLLNVDVKADDNDGDGSTILDVSLMLILFCTLIHLW